MDETDEQLGRRLSPLPRAPEAWVVAAKALPRFERAVAAVLARSRADDEFRHALDVDPAAALERSGYRFDADVVAHLMRRRGRGE